MIEQYGYQAIFQFEQVVREISSQPHSLTGDQAAALSRIRGSIDQILNQQPSPTPASSPGAETPGPIPLREEEVLRLLGENRRQAALLGAIFTADPGPLAVLVGPDLRFAYVNPAYRFLIPDAARDPVGLPYGEVWQGQDHDLYIARYQDVLAIGKPYLKTDVAHTFTNGAIRYFSLQARRMEWGDQYAVLLILWDITERREAEAAHIYSEQRFQSLFTQMTEGFALHEIIVDQQGKPCDYRFLEVNPAFERMTALKREEVVGKLKGEIPGLRGDDPKWIEIYGRVALTGEPIHFENYSPALKRHYEVFAYQPKAMQFATLFMDITERKQTEERMVQALQQAEASQQTLHALMEYIPEGITIAAAPDATIQMVSRYGQEILGGSHDQKTAGQVANEWTVYEADGVTALPDESLPLVRAIQKGEVIKNQDLVQVNAQGEALYLSCNAGPIRDASGKITGGVVAWRDIGERKKVEEALRSYRQLLETVIQNMPAAVNLMRGSDLRIEFLNPAYQMIAPGKAMVGKTLNELWPETGWDFAALCRQVLATGEPYFMIDAPFNIRRFPGGSQEQAYFSWSLHRVNLPGEDAGGILNVAWETTEHKRSEERLSHLNQELARRNSELEAERERWQGMMAGIAEEVWLCDLDQKMTLMNLPNKTAMGLSEFQDTPYLEILEEVDIFNLDGSPRQPSEAPLLRSLQGEIVRGEEIMRHRLTGRTRYRQYSSAPTHDVDGNITGAVVIVRDITDLKDAEKAARDSDIEIELHHRLLEQREQERMQIARDLHDNQIQDLLVVIYELENLRSQLENQPELSQSLANIQAALNKQVSDLRDYAEELRPPALPKFGLEAALSSHLENFRKKHPEIDISLTAHQVGGLLEEPIRLALYRIFQEALNNILKHARATQVHVRLTKGEHQVCLEVQDNGVGFDIPQDWLELARQKHLGLVGMRERAEAIGGQLKVDSHPHTGTHLVVEVPLA